MPKVIEIPTPLEGELGALLPTVDFCDTFCTTNHQDGQETLARKIFGSPPGWVVGMLKFRNAVMKLLGRDLNIPADYHERFEQGGYILFFKIYAILPGRLVLGADDQHLNFRAVIDRHETKQHNVHVHTLVEYNNRFGRVYMAIVKPFHRLVVRSLVKKAWVD